MALSEKQKSLYWRTWSAVCSTQGWRNSDSARRYALHEQAKCPRSMTAFSNSHLSLFLETAAPLADQVDIRDRDRENVEHTVQRLSAAIAELLQTAPGQYERTIKIDLADTVDLDNFTDRPTDPDNIERTSPRELENLRDTLNNRLSRLITRVKDGRLSRPDLLAAWPNLNPRGTAPFLPNNDIIAAVIGGKTLLTAASHYARPARRKMHLDPAKKFPAKTAELTPF